MVRRVMTVVTMTAMMTKGYDRVICFGILIAGSLLPGCEIPYWDQTSSKGSINSSITIVEYYSITISKFYNIRILEFYNG